VRVLVLTFSCAFASSAHADSIYVSESAGAVRPGDQAVGMLSSGEQAEFHFGVQLGHWGIELELIDAWLEANTLQQTVELTAVGLGTRYVQPMSRHWSMYLHGRVMRGWTDFSDFSGNGFGGGAGVQLEGHARIGQCSFEAALFVEADEDFYRLRTIFEGAEQVTVHRAQPDLDVTMSALALGVALGGDF
jgi:hypothetical protein